MPIPKGVLVPRSFEVSIVVGDKSIRYFIWAAGISLYCPFGEDSGFPDSRFMAVEYFDTWSVMTVSQDKNYLILSVWEIDSATKILTSYQHL